MKAASCSVQNVLHGSLPDEGCKDRLMSCAQIE